MVLQQQDEQTTHRENMDESRVVKLISRLDQLAAIKFQERWGTRRGRGGRGGPGSGRVRGRVLSKQENLFSASLDLPYEKYLRGMKLGDFWK